MYNSQFNEDKFIYENYLNYENGFFIELGAMDGSFGSNSKFFEDTLKWTGILIEPTTQFNDLIINRPNCINFNYAISDKKGDAAFLGTGGFPFTAVGGLLETMPELHKDIWNLHVQQPITVKTIPFNELTNNLDIELVDFFSIDVEGAEFEVLKTFDWNIPVYLILIELHGYDTKKDEECRKFLLDKGFTFETYIGPKEVPTLNEIWINKNNKRK